MVMGKICARILRPCTFRASEFMHFAAAGILPLYMYNKSLVRPPLSTLQAKGDSSTTRTVDTQNSKVVSCAKILIAKRKLICGAKYKLLANFLADKADAIVFDSTLPTRISISKITPHNQGGRKGWGWRNHSPTQMENRGRGGYRFGPWTLFLALENHK